MTIIDSIDDFSTIDVVGLQPDDRLPNDYLRMVARIFAAYREAPLEKAIVAYLDGFQIQSEVNVPDDTYDFAIKGGSCFIDDQFVGFLDEMLIKAPRTDFLSGEDYSVVVNYEWINITPPMRPVIRFITYRGPESINEETMLEIGRFTITPQREFIMHPQDLNGLYLKNFVKLFASVEENILENIDAFKFQHIIIPSESIAPETKSGDFVFFDFMDAMYKPARACTKKFDKAIGLYLRNTSSGSNYLIFNGIIKIDPDKYDVDVEHIGLLNLSQGSTYYLEDGCTETDDFRMHESYQSRIEFPIEQGFDNTFYVDLAEDDIYYWNPDLENIYDPGLNIVGDYEIAVPRPTLGQTQVRGKITTRFFPSNVRVGFAIDHNTLSLNMDYSSELNVMNILELVGTSDKMKVHYEAFRDYMTYQHKIVKYGAWLGELSSAGGEMELTQDERTLLTDVSRPPAVSSVALRDSNYNGFAENYTVTETELHNFISDGLIKFSKTRIDLSNWETIAAKTEELSQKIYELAVEAETSREDFQLFSDSLDINDYAEGAIKIYTGLFISNLEGVLGSTIGLDITIGGSVFKDIYFFDEYNASNTSLQNALTEKSLTSILNVHSIISVWWAALVPHLDFDFNVGNLRYTNIVSDSNKIIQEAMFMNSPRIKNPLPHGAGGTGIQDSLYNEVVDRIETVNKQYTEMWYYGSQLVEYLSDVVAAFLTTADINTAAITHGDTARTLSDNAQANLALYIQEHKNYSNEKLTRYNLWKDAQVELDHIDAQILRLQNRVDLYGQKISLIDSNITSWEFSKAALENSDGIYARMEHQQPITSIFYLSNFERIQYNYTYLTIRLKTKYTVLEKVRNNISLIQTAKDDLIQGGVILDQVKLNELNRLQLSYETVEIQLLVEIESMRAEYNKIRRENYGLEPIAQNDPDFDIRDNDTVQYANPDLACMVISE